MILRKQYFLVLFVFLFYSSSLFGQSDNAVVEVFYFKANLACCKARACNALQADVDSVLIKYFTGKSIGFKVIRLADEANKDLIAKYNAKSQTVVIVKKQGKQETVTDVSDIVQEYAKNRNKEQFEESMKAKINKVLSM